MEKGRLLALGRNVCLATPICLGMVTKENFPNTLESKEQVFRTKELFFQELSKSWKTKKKVMKLTFSFISDNFKKKV